MAVCWIGDGRKQVSFETRVGAIDIGLQMEMRRFEALPGKPEARGICFAVFPLSHDIGCCWDGTEAMPKLLCSTASHGIDMFSLDVFRFEGRPGTTRRGSVTLTVNEDDVRQTLHADMGSGTAKSSSPTPPGGLDVPSPRNVPGGHADLTESDADGFEEEPAEPVLASPDYDDEVHNVSNAIRRLSAGQAINFLFVLHGDSYRILSPDWISEESEEEEGVSEEREEEEEGANGEELEEVDREPPGNER